MTSGEDADLIHHFALTEWIWALLQRQTRQLRQQLGLRVDTLEMIASNWVAVVVSLVLRSVAQVKCCRSQNCRRLAKPESQL